MQAKVLVVEDDLVLRETPAYRLAGEGYKVFLVADGSDAVEITCSRLPDVILMDIMLPGMDGFDACRLIRQVMTTPILMLTARTAEVDRVVGLEIGADDYVTKPFSMRELLARIKAQLRRAHMVFGAPVSGLPLPTLGPLRFDDLAIDLNRCEVKFKNKRLQLKPIEYELLASFAQRQGQVLTREQLMRALWGGKYAGKSRTVDVHVRWL